VKSLPAKNLQAWIIVSPSQHPLDGTQARQAAACRVRKHTGFANGLRDDIIIKLEAVTQLARLSSKLYVIRGVSVRKLSQSVLSSNNLAF